MALKDMEDYVYEVAYAISSSPLKLPDDWKNPLGDDGVSLARRSLAVQLEFIVNSPSFEFTQEIEFCSRESIKALPYTEPEVIPHEIKPDSENPSQCIEWTMLKLLKYPGATSCRSDLDSERHIRLCLAGFFKITGCTTFSNTEVKFPTAVGCFGRFSRPVLASRLDASVHPWENKVPPSFRPVVLLCDGGNPIDSENGGLSYGAPNGHRLAAQLAWAAHPTLVVIIAHTMLEWQRENLAAPKPKAPFKLPEYALIHGIAYDAHGILIYGFFPQVLQFSDDGTPLKWGFGCVPVDTSFTSVFRRRKPAIRMELVKVLLAIQRRATHLAEIFSTLKLHKEFSNCDELWRNESLDWD
ncbi:hypothetical protein K439DRAFT_1640271 [Ramaria rubella]|nr:hypothetical protein K439DRAFT_1640271 [Ramaria rubella]